MTALDSNRQLILEEYNHDEERFVAIGYSAEARLLVVLYCYRLEDVIRIISARKATKNERKAYEEGI